MRPLLRRAQLRHERWRPRAGSSSRSARPCWWRRTARSAAPGSKRWPTTSPRCRGRGQEVIIVTSGAIAVGRRHLGLAAGPLRLEENQAAAATGQIRLAHAYQEALARHGITVAQILLTPDDTEERRRHLNARATFAHLLALGRGAGRQRERHGRHRRDPLRRQRPARRTRRADDERRRAGAAVRYRRPLHRRPAPRPGRPPDPAGARAQPEIEAMAGAAAPGYTSGGMVTKLAAARIAMQAGCPMAIADGNPRGTPAVSLSAAGRSLRSRPAPARPVPARRRAALGAQGVDRRRRQPGRRADRRRRRGAGAARRQEPAAGRRHRGRGPLRARRRGDRARPRRARDRARPVGLCERRYRPDRRAQKR